MDKILEASIKREITELNAEFDHAMHPRMNKETKRQMLHDITGRALTVRRIMRDFPSSYDDLYHQLEEITKKALANYN